MSATADLTKTVRRWLKDNLGKYCCAPLTTQDALALDAAIHIIHLWTWTSGAELPQAYANVVRMMQPHTRELAYHAVAHIGDWHDRDRLWNLSGLEPLGRVSVCAYEPGGAERRAA